MLLLPADVKIFPGLRPPVTPSSLLLEAGDLETCLLEADLGGALALTPVCGVTASLLIKEFYCLVGGVSTMLLCLVEDALTCCCLTD